MCPPWLFVTSLDFLQMVFHCSDTLNFCFLPTVCFLSAKLFLLLYFATWRLSRSFWWLKGILGKEQKLFFTTTSLVSQTNIPKGHQRHFFRKLSKEISVLLYVYLSVSVAWPIATKFDSDEGLRDITFLQVSWKIAGWMSTETKINLSSRDSCISIVRNQRRIVGKSQETDPTSHHPPGPVIND